MPMFAPTSTLGYSFSPDQSTRIRQSFNSGVLPQNASDAIRVLSLHLPAMLAGNPIAPDSLLRPGVTGAGAFSTLAPSSAPVSSPSVGGPQPAQPFASMNGSSTGTNGRTDYSGTRPNVQFASGPRPPRVGYGGDDQPSMPPASSSTPSAPSTIQPPQIDIQSLLAGLFGGFNSPGSSGISGGGSYGNPF